MRQSIYRYRWNSEKIKPKICEIDFTLENYDIDIVMSGVSDVVQLLEGFDIGLVQVAHDEVHYTIHNNFVEVIDHRTIRVLDNSWPANSRARAERMAQKYPEFTIDASVLND